MRIYLSIPFGSYLYLLHLLEMQTVIKQAIRVSVLQMCCKTRANERKENLLLLICLSLSLAIARSWLQAFRCGKSRNFHGFPSRGGSAVGGGEV